jgi:hypothetical protein
MSTRGKERVAKRWKESIAPSTSYHVKKLPSLLEPRKNAHLREKC